MLSPWGKPRGTIPIKDVPAAKVIIKQFKEICDNDPHVGASILKVDNQTVRQWFEGLYMPSTRNFELVKKYVEKHRHNG